MTKQLSSTHAPQKLTNNRPNHISQNHTINQPSIHYKHSKIQFKMYLSQYLICLYLAALALCYQTYSIRDTIRIDSFAFTQNQDYIVATQLLNQDYTTGGIGSVTVLEALPTLLLKRGKEGYQVIDRIYGGRKQNTIPQNPISFSKATGRFIISWNDSYIRVNSLKNELVEQIQAIAIEKNKTSYSKISDDGNIIFALQESTYNAYAPYANFYKWNPSTNQYTPLLASYYLNCLSVAVSPDLRSILTVANDRKLNVLTFTGETYKSSSGELVGQISFNQSPQSSLELISNPVKENLRHVILVMIESRKVKDSVSGFTDADYTKIVFAVLNETVLTFRQTLFEYYSRNRHSLYLTQNGRYLSITLSRSKEILLYKHSEQTGKFQLHRRYSGFANSLKSVAISEDGNTIVGSSSLNNNQLNQQFVFFVQCNIPNCQLCSLNNNSCSKCKDRFEPKANTCVCEAHRTLVDGRCVECLISHCALCRKNDICEECGNGYTLLQGVCLCPSYKNISDISKECISCNVEGCVKCNVPNICSKFSDGLSGEHISYSADVRIEKDGLSDEIRASGVRQSVIIYKEKETPAKEVVTPGKQEDKPKQIEVVQVKEQSKKQGDKIQITVTKAEEIEGLIIFIMALIIVGFCKRCLKRNRPKPQELNEELPAQKKDDTAHNIESKRDSKAVVMDQV